MLKIFFGLVVFTLGLIMGAYGHYVAIHSDVDHDDEASELISSILPLSEHVISEENYRCEGESKRQVGEVLSSIIGSGMAYKVNALSAGCGEGTCTIVLNYCKPWQDAECGSRILLFKLSSNGDIEPSSFTCLDLP